MADDPALAAQPDTGRVRHGAKRILVVDDDDAIREVTHLSLELVGGYEVSSAACGGDALDCARGEHFDAILLDLMMPGMDGLATLRRLRADDTTREIPVILFTARLATADRARLAQLGVHAVVAKPFDPMTLPNEVAEILGWPR